MLARRLPRLIEPVVLERSNSDHQEIWVCGRGPMRTLAFGEAGRGRLQSVMSMNDPARPMMFSARAMTVTVAMHHGPERILCLGLGGGGLVLALAEAFPKAMVDVVELDAAVVEAARRWFAFPNSPRIRVHQADAREFIRRSIRSGRAWDVVLHDCLDERYVPPHLMTLEFRRQVRAVLDREGVAAFISYAVGALRDRELATNARAFVDRVQLDDGFGALDVCFPGRLPAATFRNMIGHAAALRRLGLDAREALRRLQARPAVEIDAPPILDSDLTSRAMAALRGAPGLRPRPQTDWGS